MGLWSRLKSWVNRHIIARGQEEVPSVPSADFEPIPGPPPGPPPDIAAPEEPYEGPEYIHLVDDFGVDQGTQTWEDWYNDTLLSQEEFTAKYGEGFSTLDLIDLLEAETGEAWDWDTWRELYAERNG